MHKMFNYPFKKSSKSAFSSSSFSGGGVQNLGDVGGV
jgi:hypothetical protein